MCIYNNEDIFVNLSNMKYKYWDNNVFYMYRIIILNFRNLAENSVKIVATTLRVLALELDNKKMICRQSCRRMLHTGGKKTRTIFFFLSSLSW